jgi:hypothetical protein
VNVGDPQNPESLAQPAGAGVLISVNGNPAGQTDANGFIQIPIRNGHLHITASSATGNTFGALDLPDGASNSVMANVILW